MVKGRATAYDVDEGRLVTLMPFEDVHGNGGLLTTVRDLLMWNEHLHAGRIADQAFVEELQTPGRLANGKSHGYAFGLFVGEYRGLREISHGGATAGYRAYLTRFPDERVSVAVLCNAGTANTSRVAHDVADLYLGSAAETGAAPDGHRLGRRATGRTWSATSVGPSEATWCRSCAREDGLRVAGGPQFVPTAPGRFDYGGSAAEIFPAVRDAGHARARHREQRVRGHLRAGDSREAQPRSNWRSTPAPTGLPKWRPTCTSSSKGARWRSSAVPTVRRRCGRSTPTHSTRPSGSVRFARDGAGHVTHVRLGTGRAWDVRFARVPDLPVTPSPR